MIRLGILLISIICVCSYKQFFLERTMLSQYKNEACSSRGKAQQAYHQICYYKDVNYHTQILIDEAIYYISMDLTVPYSWLKSPNCKDKENKKCHIVQNEQKRQAEKMFKDIRTRYRLFSRQHTNNQNTVAIVGSSDLIMGEIEEINYGQIYVKDSKDSKHLSKLIGISLFVTSYKDKIALRNIGFLKANRISQQLNQMTDGAISLKLAKNNTNNFLQQLFINIQASQRMLTIFIHPLSKSGVVSIGDMSLKNTKSHPSQIMWVQMKDNSTFGAYTFAQSMALKPTVLSDNYNQAANNPAILKFAKDIYYTISSSFVFLPKDCLDWLAKSLNEETNAFCQISEQNAIFKCKWKSTQDKKKILFMKLSINLSHKHEIDIPMIALIKTSKNLEMQLTIKECLSQEHIILGQPFFQQYVVFIDYKNYKIGMAKSFYHQSEKYTVILIYILRFILFGVIFLLLLYICWRPFTKIQRFLQAKIGKKVKGRVQDETPDQQDFLD